ncbi:MAG: PAS domain-containing sensor histidine kinase, partial [Chloroflexi bacterium]|nr:PAS domain-containing sensor histidine kinase [Chloroflexota bacterium]
MDSPVFDEQRLSVLRDLALLESEKKTLYDHLTALAQTVLGAKVALMSMVARDFQFFKSFAGLPEPYASNPRTPLAGSFCQHVVDDNAPLIVDDALR